MLIIDDCLRINWQTPSRIKCHPQILVHLVAFLRILFFRRFLNRRRLGRGRIARRLHGGPRRQSGILPGTANPTPYATPLLAIHPSCFEY